MGLEGSVRAFDRELRRCRGPRVAALYAAKAFTVVQVVPTAVPRLQLPAWSYPLVVVLALLGFPLALVVAWEVDGREPPLDLPA